MEITQSPPIDAVIELLRESGLPADDLSEEMMRHYIGFGDSISTGGIIGLEDHTPYGLLRSLAVDERHRGRGHGRILVAALESYARALSLQSLYLLTTTAEDYFRKLGYSSVARREVPESIKKTAEFSVLCPDSAAVMTKRL